MPGFSPHWVLQTLPTPAAYAAMRLSPASIAAAASQIDSQPERAELPQLHHASALRNRVPILKALLKLVPNEDVVGDACEIGSGTGALLEVLAPGFPSVQWLPTEYVPSEAVSPETQWSTYGKIGRRLGSELETLDAHLAPFNNVSPAIAVDLLDDTWFEAVGSLDLLVCSNTLHVTPWACSEALFEGAGEVLRPGGQLLVYGPFKVNGDYMGADGGEGNRKFDAKLRDTNVEWGLRDVGELERLADYAGLERKRRVDMPANNLLLQFVKVHPGPWSRFAACFAG